MSRKNNRSQDKQPAQEEASGSKSKRSPQETQRELKKSLENVKKTGSPTAWKGMDSVDDFI